MEEKKEHLVLLPVLAEKCEFFVSRVCLACITLL